ncbi:lipopolysaccharide heptosyltransferase II [Candidatus Omnitrophota bacterium]
MKEAPKILFITLSNIGDVIMTLPVLDAIKEEYPDGRITCIVGPRPKGIFEGDAAIEKLIVYDKRCSLSEKFRLFKHLRSERFDVVIDLRNSLFGALLTAEHKTSPISRIPGSLLHMKQRHLCRAKVRNSSGGARSINIGKEQQDYIGRILRENKIAAEKVAVIACGARSQIKRWGEDRFAKLCSALINDLKMKVVLAGDSEDVLTCGFIAKNCSGPVLDLSAKTNIRQLAALLERSRILITNDSAVLHLGSYLDTPTVAIFGPTNDLKYGPWSKIGVIAKKDIFCRPCEKAQCRFATLDCMRLIKVEDVLRAVRNVLITEQRASLGFARDRQTIDQRKNFNRILIWRTDRIGDVILSTAVIRALRDANPSAYIAMIVRPYAREILEGNPYLDEVIVYDKKGRQRGVFASLKFAQALRGKKFDLALILHPTNRAHLISFLAGIRRRVGYDRKCGFLLSDKLRHSKEDGAKHESEYTLDLLRFLGIEPKSKELYMPLKQRSEEWVAQLLKQEGIKETDKLLAVHPGASCASKIWPADRFAQAADALSERYGFKTFVIAGPNDVRISEEVSKKMRRQVINLAGKTSVSELASLLKRCALFISNDSGPVHIAAALGTPVVSIFGRNKLGLSFLRWGPLGVKSRILHKEVGCVECLAHNCKKDFLCLKEITVDDLLKTCAEIIG